MAHSCERIEPTRARAVPRRQSLRPRSADYRSFVGLGSLCVPRRATAQIPPLSFLAACGCHLPRQTTPRRRAPPSRPFLPSRLTTSTPAIISFFLLRLLLRLLGVFARANEMYVPFRWDGARKPRTAASFRRSHFHDFQILLLCGHSAYSHVTRKCWFSHAGRNEEPPMPPCARMALSRVRASPRGMPSALRRRQRACLCCTPLT